MTTVCDPITIGNMALPQRITMSPMTRSRALDDGTPVDGQSYLNTPGIYTPEHAAGWREVADAVHARGAYLSSN